jgi:hypothetical protein
VTDDPSAQDGAASGAGGSSAGSGGAGDGGSSSGSGGAATSSSTTAAGGAATGCDQVPEYIDNLYQAAAACSPDDGNLHCQDVVDGHCCPVIVESIQSPATQAYLDFLELMHQQCPEIWEECKTVKCGPPAAGICVPDDSEVGGHCMPSR